MTSPTRLIDKDQFGPWALVTGASSGIGKEFAGQLGASGFHMVLVAGRVSLLEDVGRGIARDFGVQYRVTLDPQRVVPLQLDITSAADLAHAAAVASDLNEWDMVRELKK